MGSWTRVLRLTAIAAAVALTVRRGGPTMVERARCLVGNTPVHPDLRMVAAPAPRRIASPRTFSVTRHLISRMRPRTDGVEVVALGDGVGVRMYRPRAPVPALLWMHGGGYLIGAAHQDDRATGAFLPRRP